MDYSIRKMMIERALSAQAGKETFRILIVILGVGLLSLWTYWQVFFFISGQSQFQHPSNGVSIVLRTVVPLWFACFFPALGLGLGLYTYTHRLPRNASSFLIRPRKDYMTESQTYLMLCTAICLFAVNYRILPISPLVNGGVDSTSDLLIMTVVKQQAFIGVLGMVVVFLQAWGIIQKRGGSRRNLGLLSMSMFVVGLFIPWSGCLSLMPPL